MKKHLLFLFIVTIILFSTKTYAQWTSLGPNNTLGLTNLHLDTQSNILYVGDYEGFRFYDVDTDLWTDVTEPGSIGRQVWSITAHPDIPGKIITGRENAWFKGYMEYTDDWGITNYFVYESTGGNITDVKYCPTLPNRMFACGWNDIASGELLKSEDGGETWTPTTNYWHENMTEIAIHPTDENIIYVSGDAKITKSIDGGATWVESYAGMPSSLGVYCVSIDPFNTDILLCSNDNGIYKSVDAGANWVLVNNYQVKRFAFNPMYENYVAAITFDPYTVLLSNDIGENWTDITNSFPGDNLKDLVFSKEASSLYVLDSNGVFSTDIDISAGIQDNTISGIELNCYPNPFSVETTITFNSNIEKSKINIGLYNLLGNKVLNKTFYPSENGKQTYILRNLDKNGNQLVPGIYFCTIEINSQLKSTKKLIIKY